MKSRISPALWVLITGFILIFIWSGIAPEDQHTWFLEVLPAIVAVPVLAFTYRKFRFSDFAYFMIFVQIVILLIGGHYTYAKVPLFDWIRDNFGLERNNYDKLAHFIQGTTPALITREILIRLKVINGQGWLFFVVAATGLAISAAYELIEMGISVAEGSTADAFLGTQGYVWDTQTDMLLALIGAVLIQLFFRNVHDKSINRIV